MPIPLAIAGGAAAIGGAITSATSDGPEVNNDFLQNPEYPHSQEARDLWWNKLQKFGDQPDYGAISPDWDNIWSTVQNRVKQYYEGGPLQPGVQDKINSSLARRNVSDSPASDFLHARVAAEEGNQLKDLGTQQAIQKANFSESGRQSWLNSLAAFQGQKPGGQWNTTVQPDRQAQIGQAISGVGSAVGNYGIQKQQQNWMNSLVDNQDYGYSPFF